LLRQALAWFECQVVGEHPAGDHVLVLGKINGKPIAKAGDMTAPLSCFPTFSAIHGAALRRGITIEQPSG
jgi:Flavin reductase like domain